MIGKRINALKHMLMEGLMTPNITNKKGYITL
nr:MAG TPA: hypothetical protein [Caudoviricetes sp.]